MTAQSVTGTGTGASNKVTTKELSRFAVGPNIVIAASHTAKIVSNISPPGNGGLVTLPTTLMGSPSNYMIVFNDNNIYVADTNVDDKGNFIAFTCYGASYEGQEFDYMIIKKGVRVS